MWKDLEEDKFCVQAEEVESVRWMDFDECCHKVKNGLFKHCIVMEELEMLRKALNL